ncbi:hypothetical protein TMEN_5558 [Trichophyton mentagrophytes]|nr:hypothetical protein TMEN_5558 [Trichophyton mentagrophytes]
MYGPNSPSLPTQAQICKAHLLSQVTNMGFLGYALYTIHDAEIEGVDSGIQTNYTVVEFIDGQTLKTCLETLLIHEKEDIVVTFKDQLHRTTLQDTGVSLPES